ncbi:MAG: hypothetical protein HYZ83_06205 [Candidatus Omnitrophica bacterium]|nr:hypothetical protein [Candidatus Omnitrophota bacterium]
MLKWFPWRFIVQRLAKRQGFLDPLSLISQFQRFAQPSEVAVPVEILRLAAILYARGLMNSQAIQHNLDWVWPFWVERQFDPHDPAFIPRAFSVSHMNLTHRNWTAVGIPGCSQYSLVDPAGLVTPCFDSWSIDSWIILESGGGLVPSRLRSVSQKLLLNGNLAILTEANDSSAYLSSRVEMVGDAAFPVCRIQIQASANTKAWCVISLRPYNPEGVSFVNQIELLDQQYGWKVNKKDFVYLNQKPERLGFSDYRQGDVYHFLPLLPQGNPQEKISCDVGLATAAAVYELQPSKKREILIEIPLKGDYGDSGSTFKTVSRGDEIWQEEMKGASSLKIPDAQFQFLYDAALKSIVLHAPHEVYPGPYTYKHFWFRDAAFILHAMLCAGLFKKAEKVIDESFFSRQNPFGYFHSQDGEWDSNGQVLWILKRFCELTRNYPKAAWKNPIENAAKWIQRKREREDLEKPHAGLFPAGFSAEHLGPNDYYYWDDFWGVAGLAAASYFSEYYERRDLAVSFQNQSIRFMACIEESLKKVQKRLGHLAMPASPYRRMDTGAIGSLAVGYPLELWKPHDPRLMSSIEYLMKECFVDGGFFHDMSHSGVNPYLTLHIAQILLRAGDPRYYQVMKAVADFASPTGQWPEAIHPKTRGGCMGDGQHIWASAEWVLMIRNCFVREEKDSLILFSGIPSSWLETGEEIYFGQAFTKFGNVRLTAKQDKGKIRFSWEGKWFSAEPKIEIHLPGHEKIMIEKNQTQAEIPSAARA